MPREMTTPQPDNTELDTDDVAVGPNAPAFAWTDQRERAAFLTAEDALTDEQIAREVGISRSLLFKWRRRPEFAARVSAHLATLAEGVVTIGVARRRNRVMRLQMLIDRMDRVMDARAKNATIDEERSGLVVRKPHFSSEGDLEWEYKFDGGFVQQYRATMEQAAKELGQLNEKIEITTETMTRRYEGVNVEAV